MDIPSDITDVLPIPRQRPLTLKKPSHVHVPHHLRYPPLDIEEILEWADSHFERTGKWPIATSGWIVDAPGEKWMNVSAALRGGFRGLPGGSSLARLLAEYRGVRNRKALPPYTIEQILAWADADFQTTGQWPSALTGPISVAPGETWMAVEMALSHGLRGLPGGSSLAALLAEHRDFRNRGALPLLNEAAIQAWAEAHYQRTGKWPQAESGEIEEAPGETWMAAQKALYQGGRGLPGGASLPQLLAATRGVRNRKQLPRLTEEQILTWADAYHDHTGRWPYRSSGGIIGTDGETWSGINAALSHGQRGLPGGSSLARLLLERRGVTHHLLAPRLSESQIVAWAEAYRQRQGRWPRVLSGDIPEAPGENWSKMDMSLRLGLRGLPGGSSLKRLLESQQNA